MGKLFQRFRTFLPNRKVKAIIVYSADRKVKTIRKILGHLGMIILICLLLVTQFFRYYVLRTGHCDIDHCLPVNFASQNITFEGECSFCSSVWLDEYLTTPEDGSGFRLTRLKISLIQLYTNIIAYLFVSFGAYFYNPYFLIIHLISKSFVILNFVIKLFLGLLTFRGTIGELITIHIFCPSLNCFLFWVIIYTINITFIVMSIILTLSLHQLISLTVIQQKFANIFTKIDENWVTTLHEDKDN